jgi:TM2 domain-containing membrane protein YozV
MSFFVTRNGQQYGPYPRDDVERMLKMGQLSPSDLAWREGQPTWVALSTLLPEAASLAPPPLPPAPSTTVAGAPPMAPAKSRVAYVLLGLFLGGLGIHNFYAGYNGRAVAQLLITLLLGWLIVPLFVVWIWALIEIIAVTHDARGSPLV